MLQNQEVREGTFLEINSLEPLQSARSCLIIRVHAHFLRYILHTPTESFQLGGREGVIIAITSVFLGCSTVHTIIVMCQLKLNSKYTYYNFYIYVNFCYS